MIVSIKKIEINSSTVCSVASMAICFFSMTFIF